MSNKPTLQDLLDVQAHFGLPSPALVEKDFQVAKALAAIAGINTGRLRLVFSGGTALGRAHKLIQRMSEDIDLKITADSPPTRVELRQLRDVITSALLEAGFGFDPSNKYHRVSRNNSQYTLYRLPYQPTVEGQGALRPEIQIETALWPVRLPTVEKDVRSFYAEAFQQPPEVAAIACVAISETAAEKFVALTRRVAAERATPSAPRDNTLVRHIYDLHAIQAHCDFDEVAALIPIIMQADAEAYGNQRPLYRSAPEMETRLALMALESDPHYGQAFADLNRDLVYGQRIGFEAGIAVLKQLGREIFKS